MSRFVRMTTLWLWGGIIYYIIELLWRGHSHPSMFVLGGLCLLLVGGLNNYLPWKMGFAWQPLLGAVIITIAELATGLIVNIWLGWGVWDYSDMPLNIMGQVCLWFMLAWIPLAAFAILLDDWLRWKLYGEERPHYTIF